MEIGSRMREVYAFILNEKEWLRISRHRLHPYVGERCHTAFVHNNSFKICRTDFFKFEMEIYIYVSGLNSTENLPLLNADGKSP